MLIAVKHSDNDQLPIVEGQVLFREGDPTDSVFAHSVTINSLDRTCPSGMLHLKWGR
jgi:hypothetical protein